MPAAALPSVTALLITVGMLLSCGPGPAQPLPPPSNPAAGSMYRGGGHGCDPPSSPPSSPQSTTIAALPDGTILTLDPDHDALIFLNGAHRFALPTGAGPAQLSWRGDHVVVSNLRDRSLGIYSISERALLATLDVGAEPYGVAFLDDVRVAVALQADRTLAVVDIIQRRVVHRLPLEADKPRTLAVLGDGRVVVTHLLSGTLSVVDVDAGTVEVRERPFYRTSGAATVTPGGDRVAVLSVRDHDAQQVPYYGPPAPLTLLTEVQPEDGCAGLATNTGFDGTAVAFLHSGAVLAVLHRGPRELRIFSPLYEYAPLVIPVGHGADGLAVSADGQHLYVHNAFDLSITRVDVRHLTHEEDTPPLGTATLPHVTMPFAEVTLPPQVRLGRELFHDTRDPRLTGNANACATCHVDGRHDGRTWFTPNGPRNTPSLAGARPGVVGIASTTAPLHWDGEFATPRDLSLTIDRVMHGNGLEPEELDAIAAYIDTIPRPDRPTVVESNLQRGEAIFNDPAVGCRGCHAAEHGTDNITHEMDDGAWQTPVLDGLAWTAPYLHDGSAATIEEVLERLVKTDRMGHGSHLTDAELRALASYLRSL